MGPWLSTFPPLQNELKKYIPLLKKLPAHNCQQDGFWRSESITYWPRRNFFGGLGIANPPRQLCSRKTNRHPAAIFQVPDCSQSVILQKVHGFNMFFLVPWRPQAPSNEHVSLSFWSCMGGTDPASGKFCQSSKIGVPLAVYFSFSFPPRSAQQQKTNGKT